MFSLWVLVQHRRQALPFLAGAAAIAIPWFVVNIAAYGLLFPPYYSAGRISLHSDFLEAVLANLVSPARGILLLRPSSCWLWPESSSDSDGSSSVALTSLWRPRWWCTC